MVCYPVEQGGSHFFIAKDFHPFNEAKVGGDDQRGFLVKLADEME